MNNFVRIFDSTLPFCLVSTAAGKWRVIALTNNFTKIDAAVIGQSPPLPEEEYPNFSVESELAFLGWQDGAAPLHLREMFDDFCDSSTLGMRCAWSVGDMQF